MALIGFSCFLLSCILFILILKLIFFSNYPLFQDLGNFEAICGSGRVGNLSNLKCENLVTVYWLMVFLLVLIVFSILTLYPFFRIKKNKDKF